MNAILDEDPVEPIRSENELNVKRAELYKMRNKEAARKYREKKKNRQ